MPVPKLPHRFTVEMSRTQFEWVVDALGDASNKVANSDAPVDVAFTELVSELRDLLAAPAKTCGCGRVYSYLAWARLPFIGDVRSEDETGRYVLELRNCNGCGSTIGIEEQVS